jgi:hypothetical protein
LRKALLWGSVSSEGSSFPALLGDLSGILRKSGSGKCSLDEGATSVALEADVNIKARPLVVTISHELGKQRARERIQLSLGQIRTQLAPFVTSIEDNWTDDRLNFRVVALGQTVIGQIEVFEEFVRVEVALPGVLGFIGEIVRGRISQQGTSMLEKPKV